MKIKEKYGDRCVLSKELRSEMLTKAYLGDPQDGVAVIVVSTVLYCTVLYTVSS